LKSIVNKKIHGFALFEDTLPLKGLGPFPRRLSQAGGDFELWAIDGPVDTEAEEGIPA
jgi:hypothetical protein